MTKINRLILFTESFPCPSAAEDSFVIPELDVAPIFSESIVIVPSNIVHYGVIHDFKIKHPDINIDDSFFKFKRVKRNKISAILKLLFCFQFWKYICLSPLIILNKSKIIELISYLVNYFMCLGWLKVVFKNKTYTSRDTFYTYWLMSQASALAKVKPTGFFQLSRAHGIDIFNERWSLGSIPFREITLKRIDKVFVASKAGMLYMQQHFQKISDKISFSYLGIPEKSVGYNEYSESDKLRVLSCSTIIPLKRVDKIAKVISEFAKKNPHQHISWTHVGSGNAAEENRLAEILKQLPPNLGVNLTGYIPNNHYLELLDHNDFDVFVTASITEGGCPISIVEAQARGIPAIGTMAGGIPEVITKETGVTLPIEFSQEEFELALKTIYQDKATYQIYRNNSKKNWETNFKSENTHLKFYQSIIDLIRDKNPIALTNPTT